MYKYTFPMIVHTYILVYTLNMQKCDIVNTLYHALCISGQNSTKQTSIPNTVSFWPSVQSCITAKKNCSPKMFFFWFFRFLSEFFWSKFTKCVNTWSKWYSISESETLDNTCLSGILEHILLLTNSVILVNCKPFLTLYLTSGSLVLDWLDWF